MKKIIAVISVIFMLMLADPSAAISVIENEQSSTSSFVIENEQASSCSSVIEVLEGSSQTEVLYTYFEALAQ